MNDEIKFKQKNIKPITKRFAAILKQSRRGPILHPIKSEREIILLRDLLGNFSDQTGASFG
jgi:hypothetical protein